MKRLKYFILLFFLALSIPLAYVSWRTFAGMAREERTQLSYFSETFFDDIERELAELLKKEEARSVEEYSPTLIREGSPPRPSPLSRPPSQPFILGYLQNNSDGTFQSPMIADLGHVPANQRELADRLREVNRIFNQKKFDLPTPMAASFSAVEPEISPRPAGSAAVPKKDAQQKEEAAGLADRYLTRRQKSVTKDYLGQREIRTEALTKGQALNLATEEQSPLAVLSRGLPAEAPETADSARPQSHVRPDSRTDMRTEVQADAAVSESSTVLPSITANNAAEKPNEEGADRPADIDPQRYQAEVAPFQSIFITPDQIFIFRRLAINNQIFRQGLIIQVSAFLDHLAKNQFEGQPLSDFMTLQFRIFDHGQSRDALRVGPVLNRSQFTAHRRFPAPFDFFSADLETHAVPHSPARRPLRAAVVIIGTVMLIGLLAIYHSVRAVVALSERRNQFVSSVTHELKTPLTNIRMYVEMLEQGIAATPQQEQDYLHVLDMESARLSRLINNVLELAKLEKNQRRFHYDEGDLTDVLGEVRLIMSRKLKQEGFVLITGADAIPSFTYDREVLVQLLVNLIENSIKFGKQSNLKQITVMVDVRAEHVRIAVSDTGPGIPRAALKKIFNDFFRVENESTRNAGGTGIGLALVKKFVEAMGGRIQAANNHGPGCTITLYLPRQPSKS